MSLNNLLSVTYTGDFRSVRNKRPSIRIQLLTLLQFEFSDKPKARILPLNYQAM